MRVARLERSRGMDRRADKSFIEERMEKVQDYLDEMAVSLSEVVIDDSEMGDVHLDDVKEVLGRRGILYYGGFLKPEDHIRYRDIPFEITSAPGFAYAIGFDGQKWYAGVNTTADFKGDSRAVASMISKVNRKLKKGFEADLNDPSGDFDQLERLVSL